MANLGDKAGSKRKRTSARATRIAGQLTRSRLLDAASTLFKARGLSGVSISEIADAADVFPSQITYYFHTKEALFVEAACRDMLHIAERAETAAARTRAPTTYMRALVDAILGADGLPLFIEALLLSRQRTDLASQVARTVERLHVEGERAFRRELTRHGWEPINAPDITSRRFWAIALGVTLEGQGMGRNAAEMSAAMYEALGEMAKEA